MSNIGRTFRNLSPPHLVWKIISDEDCVCIEDLDTEAPSWEGKIMSHGIEEFTTAGEWEEVSKPNLFDDLYERMNDEQ